MSYASASDVAQLTPHIISACNAGFTASTVPSLTAVNNWLSAGCAFIEAKIGSRGYGAVPANSPLYSYIVDLNATYGAWRAERSLLSSRVSKMENSRADFFQKEFTSGLNDLVALDLSTMGVPRSYKAPAHYAGGISLEDKQEQENNTDRIVPRFSRGQFKNDLSRSPETINSDEEVRQDP